MSNFGIEHFIEYSALLHTKICLTDYNILKHVCSSLGKTHWILLWLKYDKQPIGQKFGHP